MGVMPSLSEGPVLGLAEAAKACGVSVSTVRRKRADLEELGATATQSGWRIPIAALIGSGLMPAATPPPHETRVLPSKQPLAQSDNATPSTAGKKLREELDTLRSRLAAAEQRAAVAEAVAAERERLIETQARALRMLEAPVTATPASASVARVEPVEPTSDQPRPPTKLSLWERIRGASAAR